MDYKIKLTKTFLQELGMEYDDKSIKKNMSVFWQNPRRKGQAGLKLTEAGFKALTEKLELKSYAIQIPKETEWTSRLELRLNNYIDCPYYIFKNQIYVFSEKMAVQLVLFSGDVAKFGQAKARSATKKIEDQLDKVD